MKLIPSTLTRQLGRQILVARKVSPRVLFVAGLGGVVVSTVLACRATLKVVDVVEDIENEVANVKLHLSETEHYNKDMTYVYAKSAVRIGKLYAPAVIVGTLSIAALTGSHVTLSRRNAGLTAAYAALSRGFDDYRERVKAEVGKEKELDIHRGVSNLDVVNENGKKELVKSGDPNKYSAYARIFDEVSVNWQKNAEMNKIFITCQQNYANNLLQARGHIFLNEVYDMLGLDRSTAGQVVGWVIGPDGDNFIDFGIFEANNTGFVNGWERSIVLDFNVDGVIYDKI